MKVSALMFALALGASGAASAQVSSGSGQGQLSSMVKSALADAAAGKCSEQTMQPMLRYQCQQGMAPMQARLKQLGAVKSLSYQGIQQTPMGPAEAWIVQFEQGQMFWLAALGTDGKLMTFWSPG